MSSFVYTSLPTRMIFSAGSLKHLAREINALAATKALILSTPEQRTSAQMVADLLGPRAAGLFDRAVMHTPIETAREARDLAHALGAFCVVAIGGSTTGLSKAIALEYGLPVLAIPTTYAGSEMTPVDGITEGSLKRTGRDPRVLPPTVIYDVELSLGFAVALSVTSGINAIASAAPGLYAADGNPVLDLMAEEGSARWSVPCLCSGLLRRMSRRARPRFTVHGCVARCWAALGCLSWPDAHNHGRGHRGAKADSHLFIGSSSIVMVKRRVNIEISKRRRLRDCSEGRSTLRPHPGIRVRFVPP